MLCNKYFLLSLTVYLMQIQWALDKKVINIVCDFTFIFSMKPIGFQGPFLLTWINTLGPIQNNYHFADDMKLFELRLRFHWSLFLRVQLAIFQHWFREWLGADQAPSHCLNQWWSIYWCTYASLGLNALTVITQWISNHMSNKGCGMTLLIHSQTTTVAPLKFGNGYQFHPMLYDGCNYSSMLGLKLIHVSKRDPCSIPMDYHIQHSTGLWFCHNTLCETFPVSTHGHRGYIVHFRGYIVHFRGRLQVTTDDISWWKQLVCLCDYQESYQRT